VSVRERKIYVGALARRGAKERSAQDSATRKRNERAAAAAAAAAVTAADAAAVATVAVAEVAADVAAAHAPFPSALIGAYLRSTVKDVPITSNVWLPE